MTRPHAPLLSLNGLGAYPPEPQAPPSTYAIAALADGEDGALGRVIALTLIRAVPVGAGLMLAGEREGLVKKSLVVSTTITASMLALALLSKNEASP